MSIKTGKETDEEHEERKMSKPVIGMFVGLLLGITWAGVGSFGCFALAALFAIVGYLVGRAIDAGAAEDLNQYLNRSRRS